MEAVFAVLVSLVTVRRRNRIGTNGKSLGRQLGDVLRRIVPEFARTALATQKNLAVVGNRRKYLGVYGFAHYRANGLICVAVGQCALVLTRITLKLSETTLAAKAYPASSVLNGNLGIRRLACHRTRYLNPVARGKRLSLLADRRRVLGWFGLVFSYTSPAAEEYRPVVRRDAPGKVYGLTHHRAVGKIGGRQLVSCFGAVVWFCGGDIAHRHKNWRQS